ncbi:hypothetical protein [Ramlibacter sp.]|uniref:hypothetical protein n=1 Tax=Ramlibacter sp. TaxID=1917967 RepID=UPI003D14AF71
MSLFFDSQRDVPLVHKRYAAQQVAIESKNAREAMRRARIEKPLRAAQAALRNRSIEASNAASSLAKGVRERVADSGLVVPFSSC